MTTYPVKESAELAEALTRAIEKASPDAVSALVEMRSMATPGNGWSGPASVPWEAREPAARAIRAVAADRHPLSAELESLADGLEQSLAWRMVNHPGYTGPAPRPAPTAQPASEAPAGSF